MTGTAYFSRLGGERTSIDGMVAAAARDAERGERVWRSVGHYSVEAEPVHDGGWAMTLRHYGTPILNVQADRSGALTSAIDRAWWGSRTDMSAIAKAHRALGMRRSIKRGELIAW